MGIHSENYQKWVENLLDVDEAANLSGTKAILKIRESFRLYQKNMILPNIKIIKTSEM